MQRDIENHPIQVGDKVVYNTGKHDNGVKIGTVVKLRGTNQIEVDDGKGCRWSIMRKEASYVYVIKS